ncbi:MAG: RNA polymerase sigma factor [Candidatus Dormibacteraceae bacterium]
MGMTGESDLISRATAGDKAAFEALLEPIVAPAARLAYAMLQDRAEAEDVVQESAVKAWRKLGSFRPGADFKPWFLAIVANQCRMVRRTSWWAVLRLERTPADRSDSETNSVLSMDLRRALLALPSDQRAALALHFYLDLPLDEVAEVLGVSVAGVKSRINRALKRMRPALMTNEVVS